jgi:26S proteasome non-ATPase regulatory subunit 10
LHWAVSYNHLPIVQLLAERKTFDVDAPDGSGWTALMMACSRKDAEAIVNLLLAKDADVNAKSTLNSTNYERDEKKRRYGSLGYR